MMKYANKILRALKKATQVVKQRSAERGLNVSDRYYFECSRRKVDFYNRGEDPSVSFDLYKFKEFLCRYEKDGQAILENGKDSIKLFVSMSGFNYITVNTPISGETFYIDEITLSKIRSACFQKSTD